MARTQPPVVTDDSGTLLQRYLYGNAIDQVLAMEDYSSGDTYYALTDGLGTVRDIIDESGNVDEHREYDSFGEVTSIDDGTNSLADDAYSATSGVGLGFMFGYTGRDYDPDSELQYNRARWYDPALRRWITEDPIGFGAGDTNLQRYVGNQSPMYIDPLGLSSSNSSTNQQDGDYSVNDLIGVIEFFSNKPDDPDDKKALDETKQWLTDQLNREINGEYLDKDGNQYQPFFDLLSFAKNNKITIKMIIDDRNNNYMYDIFETKQFDHHAFKNAFDAHFVVDLQYGSRTPTKEDIMIHVLTERIYSLIVPNDQQATPFEYGHSEAVKKQNELRKRIGLPLIKEQRHLPSNNGVKIQFMDSDGNPIGNSFIHHEGIDNEFYIQITVKLPYRPRKGEKKKPALTFQMEDDMKKDIKWLKIIDEIGINFTIFWTH